LLFSLTLSPCAISAARKRRGGSGEGGRGGDAAAMVSVIYDGEVCFWIRRDDCETC